MDRLPEQELLDGGKSVFYNAGQGKGYSNKEVINEVEKATGLSVKIKVLPKREGDANALYADISKIKKELGWEPKYTLEDIVKTAFLWHKNNPKGYKS